MFGRAQPTSLPSLPSQNVPIDFSSAVSSKDAAHSRAKLDHDRSKLSLASHSPGQAMHLQDSKSSAWDKPGVVVSVRPDRLSYVIKVDNRFFTRPRHLFRPISPDTPDTPFPIVSSTPPSSPPQPRCSLCLQSRVNSVLHQSSLSPSSSISTLLRHYAPFGLLSHGQNVINDKDQLLVEEYLAKHGHPGWLRQLCRTPTV